MDQQQKLEAAVEEWNEAYREMGKEVADLEPDAYEAEVGATVLDVCGNDIDFALAVLNHESCEGGWMIGNAGAWLERQRPHMTIRVRAAKPDEILGEDEGRSFDGTDWETHFFCGLNDGDWVVEIGGENHLAWQAFGNFRVHKEDDGGEYQKIS